MRSVVALNYTHRESTAAVAAAAAFLFHALRALCSISFTLHSYGEFTSYLLCSKAALQEIFYLYLSYMGLLGQQWSEGQHFPRRAAPLRPLAIIYTQQIILYHLQAGE